MRAVIFERLHEEIKLSLVTRSDPQPAEGEVLLKVRFVGINPADMSQMLGRYQPPSGVAEDIAGIEVSGEVIQCGAGVANLSVGDRVFGLVDGGGLADRVAVPEPFLAIVPPVLGERDAAAVPEAFITAHDALVDKGRAQKGERICVTGGNGGVGSAAIQIALALGCDVTAVSRSEGGRAFIAELGAEPWSEADFLGNTGLKGSCDVIIDLVGGNYIGAAVSNLAMDGRLVLVSTSAGAEVTLDARELLFRRLTLRGTTLRKRPFGQKAAAVESFAETVVPMLQEGSVSPVVDSVFPSSAASAAFARLAAKEKRGKVLLDFESDA